MSGPEVICLTPVKDEAWILDKFLSAASVWADHIIVADQGSTDGSREIAAGYPKVELIENPSEDFNEPERQKLLIDAARQFPGPRFLLALDADEFLTADGLDDTDWDAALSVPPGTNVVFNWAIIRPDLESYYIYPADFRLGYMDDGAAHEGKTIHSPRVPCPSDAPKLKLSGLRVMHFSCADWNRFRSKLRWYMCWEALNKPDERGPLDLYRWYWRDYWIPESRIRPIPDGWTEAYEERGIELLTLEKEDIYRWDEEILGLFEEHGVERFRRIPIWDMDWRSVYKSVHGEPPPESLRDPRTPFERWVHGWFESTQKYYSLFPAEKSRSRRLFLRGMQTMLRRLGW